MPAKSHAKSPKHVLIISASYRPKSNSHALCQEVAKGVEAAGNKAEIVRLKGKTIGFCTGCYACQKTGQCVIRDDAAAIIEKICKADAVVFGTPVYYFSIAGQLKTLLDRCVAKWPKPDPKPYYLVATMGDNEEWDLVKAPIEGFVACFEGATLKGCVLAGGVYEQGAVLGTRFMRQAFALGKRI